MDTETTVALIGAAAVAGTIVGTIVGARIQAGSGHAQAQAARDAAATAARASRESVLGERRRTVLAAYIRAADLCVDACARSYTSGSLEENDPAYKVFVLVQAEAELVSPSSMDGHLSALHDAVRNIWSTAHTWAPHGWAWRALTGLGGSGGPEADRARAVLERLRSPGGSGGPRTFAQLRAAHDELRQALEALPGLGPDLARSLLQDGDEPNRSLEERTWREQHYAEVRGGFIEAAREVLGTHET
ncbi:hypothetical protein ACH5AO_07375 [Streptomyces sp. NPDC018964]|uniref:hypothetical protein n=1 Tax=Streptomyces sp. NPDC018964 TaxID=3365058 RepID=UPI0037A7FF6B